MHIRNDQTPRSFGRRRLPVEATGLDRTRPDPAAGLLGRTLRVSAVVGFLAVVGTTQLARWIAAGDASTRIADATFPVPADPETTGAIASAGAARGTHLDPCGQPVSGRLRP